MDIKTAGGNIIVRPMEERDLSDAHAMTTALNWPHTLRDWQQMVAIGHALIMETAGQMIGTACLVPQGNYASIGLIVISDDFQGKGLGRQIMNEIMSCAPADTSLYLTATAMGKPLYEKLGFTAYGVVEQYQHIVEQQKITRVKPQGDAIIREMLRGEAPGVKKMMNAATGMERHAVGELVLKHSVRTLVIEEDGNLTGFAACREFGRGYSIGPVIAKTPHNALALISHHLMQCDQQFVRLDILAQYSEIGDQLSIWGLNKVDVVSQMVRGKIPSSDPTLIQFCLVSQAMG